VKEEGDFLRGERRVERGGRLPNSTSSTLYKFGCTRQFENKFSLHSFARTFNVQCSTFNVKVEREYHRCLFYDIKKRM